MASGKVHTNKTPGGPKKGPGGKGWDAPLPQPKKGKGSSDGMPMKAFETRKASPKG